MNFIPESIFPCVTLLTLLPRINSVKNGPYNAAGILGSGINLTCITDPGYKVEWQFIKYSSSSDTAQEIPGPYEYITKNHGQQLQHHLAVSDLQFKKAGLYICNSKQPTTKNSLAAASVFVMTNLSCHHNYSRDYDGSQVVGLECGTSFTGTGFLNLAWLDSNGSIVIQNNYSFDSFEFDPYHVLSLHVNVCKSCSFNYTCVATFHINYSYGDVARNVVYDSTGSRCSAAAVAAAVPLVTEGEGSTTERSRVGLLNESADYMNENSTAPSAVDRSNHTSPCLSHGPAGVALVVIAVILVVILCALILLVLKKLYLMRKYQTQIDDQFRARVDQLRKSQTRHDDRFRATVVRMLTSLQSQAPRTSNPNSYFEQNSQDPADETTQSFTGSNEPYDDINEESTGPVRLEGGPSRPASARIAKVPRPMPPAPDGGDIHDHLE